MKNNLETMKEIKTETLKQIENNLVNEYIITSLTIYDKNNSIAVNLFLTNAAIFMQESNEVEKIKKRLFNKIVDIKLTSTEFYIEFLNGYKIVGDTIPCQNDVNRFFECIKTNTTIKASSTKDLQNVVIEPIPNKIISRINPFSNSEEKEIPQNNKLNSINVPTNIVNEDVRTLLDEEPVKKKNKGLIIGIIVGVSVLLIGLVIGIIFLINNNKKAEVDPAIVAVQARTAELLDYQVDVNNLYDYVFELTEYYEEYKVNFVTQSKLEIEENFNTLNTKFEKEAIKTYSSTSEVYKIYDVSKIDAWINEDITLTKELFKLYEEIIDEDYRNDANIVSLESKLDTTTTKIKKLQDCLTEEKDALKKVLSSSGYAETETKDSNKNSTKSEATETSDTKESTKTDDTKEEVTKTEDEYSYESKEKETTTNKVEGKQGDANYVSE